MTILHKEESARKIKKKQRRNAPRIDNIQRPTDIRTSPRLTVNNQRLPVVRKEQPRVLRSDELVVDGVAAAEVVDFALCREVERLEL